MKEPREILPLVLLAFLFWTSPLHAADPAWEYIYEGDILPDDASLGNDAWQLMGDNLFAEITDQGELHIGDIGVDHCFFLYNITDPALMQEATIEARVKVLSQSGAASFEVFFGMQDGSNSKWLDLFPDHILLDNSNYRYDVDMTEYHVLRMARNAGDIHIYVDDEQVLSESHVGAGETWIGFIFGAGCTLCRSEQYWDYLVFTTEGGFSPDELPSYASMRETGFASDPTPANGAEDVLHDVRLSWTAGEFAVKHDVYMGTSFEDVNTAESGTLVSQGQTDTEYTPDSVLQFGQTYYWRVDEVNGAPDYAVFRGDVWSFTTETYGYPITALTAQASAQQATSPAGRTIDGSGLNEFDQHGFDLKTMWVTPGGLPAWIEYTFDRVYKLHELWVWNANSELEMFMGFGAKDVTVECSTDGATWTAVENVSEFAQGPGLATYTPNTTINLGGALARHVRLTINTTWGSTGIASLSEVRFFCTPVQAFAPDPADGAIDVSVDVALNWRPGREASSHEVYFGTDASAVAEGTMAPESTTDHSYVPPAMDLGTTYYWKVDEVGDTGTYAGDLWSFTSQEVLVVDDFESYNDDIDAETTIWQTWIDGVTDKASGSQVGYTDAPFAEKTIVHGGRQSMPLQYNNTSFAFSEGKRTFDSAQDWTARGIKTLSLFFAGAADNGGQLYVKINSTKVAYDGDAADLAKTDWQVWNIDLSTVGDVSSVRSLTIGIEGSGTTGILYIDDIGLSAQSR